MWSKTFLGIKIISLSFPEISNPDFQRIAFGVRNITGVTFMMLIKLNQKLMIQLNQTIQIAKES